MINFKTLLCISIILFFATSKLSAQENEDKPAMKVSGYLDTYYSYDFNKPNSRNRQFTNMAARHNEFNINHAYILGEYNNDNIRATLGLQTGTYADFNYAAEPSDLAKMIYQAHAGFKIANGIWMDAGVFGGHTGYEAVESINNELYSRALATEYTPYYETGIRITAELSEEVTLTGVILNGWQNITETNDTKAFGMNINYKASDAIEFNYGNYFGDEGDDFLGSRFRNFHHVYIRYQITEKLHSVVSYDFGNQDLGSGKGNFDFLTFISQYKLSQKFSFAFRYEHVDDEFQILIPTTAGAGFIGDVYTLNLNYHINENAMFRIESRFFDTSNEIFNDGDSAESNNEVISASLAIKF